MLRRLGFASLLVVAFAFGGASAAGVQLLPSRQLVVSIVWLDSSEQAEEETPSTPRPLTPQFTISNSAAPRSIGVRRLRHERWLFQRPPPSAA
jgi:hypothetical protein